MAPMLSQSPSLPVRETALPTAYCSLTNSGHQIGMSCPGLRRTENVWVAPPRPLGSFSLRCGALCGVQGVRGAILAPQPCGRTATLSCANGLSSEKKEAEARRTPTRPARSQEVPVQRCRRSEHSPARPCMLAPGVSSLPRVDRRWGAWGLGAQARRGVGREFSVQGRTSRPCSAGTPAGVAHWRHTTRSQADRVGSEEDQGNSMVPPTTTLWGRRPPKSCSAHVACSRAHFGVGSAQAQPRLWATGPSRR